MRVAVLLSLIPLLLAAQNAVPATSEPKTEDQAALEGQVLDSITGEPVGKAAIVLSWVDAAGARKLQGYRISTDNSGRFALTNLEPGRYRMSITHAGYVDREVGGRGRPTSEIVSLSRGQTLTGLSVKLTPQGVISGRVQDPDGDPFAGVNVQLLQISATPGNKLLQPIGVSAVATNDLGEFRVYGVPPGRYYLCVTARQNPLSYLDRSASAASGEEYVPIYYPGTPEVLSATELMVTAGARLSANVTFAKTRVGRITGRVVNRTGSSGDVKVELVPQRFSLSLGQFSNQFTIARADDSFELRGVPPGAYYVTASLQDRGSATQRGRTYVARVPVDVAGGNLDGMVLTLGPTVDVHGWVRVEGESKVQLEGLRVMFRAPDFGIMYQPKAEANGEFRVEQLHPDVYDLSISLPSGFYLKSVRSGETSVRDFRLDLINGPPGDLEILLSPNAGEVRGTVLHPQTRQPLPGATVVLIPQEQQRRERQNYYQIANTDPAGGFALKSVAPGAYNLYAREDVEYGAFYDPDFLRTVEGLGEPVSLSEKTQLSLQLTAIPGDARGPRP